MAQSAAMRKAQKQQLRLRTKKVGKELSQWLLIATVFVPFGVELIRLIEQLLKPFTHCLRMNQNLIHLAASDLIYPNRNKENFLFNQT
jgi:hypothetical protein